MESHRPARIAEQSLAQLDRILLLLEGLVDTHVPNPPRQPCRLGPIDPLFLPRQTHQSIDQDFFGLIARTETHRPGHPLILIIPEVFGWQNQHIGPAAVVERIEPRSTATFSLQCEARNSSANSADSLQSAPRWPWQSTPLSGER